MKNSFLLGALTLALSGSLAVAGTPDDQSTDMKSDKFTDNMAGEKAASLYFDTDSAKVDESDADAKLSELVSWARCHPKQAIILEGYADPRGTQKHNSLLSARRAVSVRTKLIELGVRPHQLVLAVYGETRAKGEPMSKDRRVTARIADEPIAGDDLSG